MDIVKNCAVRSKAGRDKGRYFAVTELCGEYAIIADGNLRPLSRPKKKKLKHLEATKVVFDAAVFTDNRRLHEAIKSRFNEKEDR